MEPTVSDLLQCTAELFDDDPSTWIQGAYWHYKSKVSVSVTEADSFCILGGLKRAHYLLTRDEESNTMRTAVCLLVDILKKDFGFIPSNKDWGLSSILVDWNDAKDRTFEDVKALLAIALEES